MADPGWVGAYGAAGGYKYLADLIAERKKDEILRQQQYEYERSQAFREEEARQRAEEQRAINERLLRAEERAYGREARQELGQKAERLTENTPIGARLNLPQIATLAATDQQGLVGATPITQAPGLVERLGTAQAAPPTGPVTGGESIYTGTAKQQHEQFKEELDQARYERMIANDEESKRRAEAHEAAVQARFDESQARLASQFAAGFGRPNFVIVDRYNPETGVTEKTAVNKRELAPGEVIGQAPPPAAMRTQATETEAALGGLAELRTLYKPEWVGPLAGRIAKTKTLTTGGEPGQAEFLSQIATVRNRVIKAITGAQMSEPEARRIMEQIPDETLPPSTFEARMNATEKNYQMLLDIIRRRGTGGTPAAPRTPAAGAGDPMGILGP